MARHNAKGRTKGGPPFVRVFYYLMDSPAWLSLMPTDRAVLLQIMRRYNGQNNGLLGASGDALASECRIRPNTVSDALRRLIAAGFIERTQEASFACKMRLAAEYRVTCFRCDRTGQRASNDFRQWTPTENLEDGIG